MSPIQARDFAAIESFQQILFVGCHQLDEMIVEGLLVGKRLAFADGFFGQRAIAAALGHDAAQRSGCVVFYLLLHDGVHLTTHQNGMRGAGVSAGRHGSDVAGFQNEESSGGRARAAGRHISDDRHRRGDKLLDGFAHGIHETAGSVQAHQQQGGIFLLGLPDGVRQDFDCDRMNDAIHVDGQHMRSACCQARRRQREEDQKSQ